ncbi:hypothetical protein UlMin_003399 [Ulmus minor]
MSTRTLSVLQFQALDLCNFSSKSSSNKGKLGTISGQIWVAIGSRSWEFEQQAETKGFLRVTYQKDGYTFVYPFGWQEIVIEGQDKVLKDVIEPLENVSINLFPKNKQDIREFGPPQQVAETLIKKVMAPANQKKKLLSILQCRWNLLFFFKFEARNLFLRISLIYTIGGNYCRKEKMPTILKHALESLSMKCES